MACIFTLSHLHYLSKLSLQDKWGIRVRFCMVCIMLLWMHMICQLLKLSSSLLSLLVVVPLSCHVTLFLLSSLFQPTGIFSSQHAIASPDVVAQARERERE